MATTQRAYDWVRSRIAATAHREASAARERDARAEIDRLHHAIANVLRPAAGAAPRETLDAALSVSALLQVVTANLDACAPMPASFAGARLVALADAHLSGHSDAIERGMKYTADSTIRTLGGD